MSDNRQIGFGVLGCGVIGEFHAQAITEAPSARLIAVADADWARAKGVAEKFGCGWHESLEGLLENPEVEVVNVCTPSGFHADQAIQAAQAGRHVLVEKPLDRSLAKVNRLINYCKRQGLKLGCIFQCRFSEGARRIKEAVEEGRFGRLVSGSAETIWYRSQEYYDSADWRGTLALDGGCFWNQGVHYIDLLCWIMGEPRKVLWAYLATLAHEMEAEDFGVAQVLFRNGAVGTIRASTATYPGLPTRLEICGTKGCAVLANDLLTYFAVEGEEELTEEKETGTGAAADARGAGYTGHVAQIQDYAEAVLYDRVPLVDGIEGRRAVKLLTEIYRVAGMRQPRTR